MRRLTPYLLAAGLGLALAGCSDSSREPSSPEFAPAATGCDLSTARNLVNSIFPNDVRQTVNGLLQTIQNSGPGTPTSTDAGFELLALLATHGPSSPVNGSAFANAIIPCQNVGPVALPIDFSAALGANGAFAVRGSSGDKTAAVSHDVKWGLEPPLNTSAARLAWNDITTAPSGVTTRRLLAYGMPVSVPGFTNETLVGTIFEWFTIPTLSFNPGVVVGTCITDGSGSEYLIQHHAAIDGGEIVPSATPSFCPTGLSGIREADGWSLLAAAHRLVDFFAPQPLAAAALGTRPPGGSIGNLSPSGAVNPGQITLAFVGIIADGKTGVPITVKTGGPVTVTVTPTGSTPLDGANVRLIATTNLGATVVATGNTAPTENGVAVFPQLKISKAGGYRLIATLDGFGQNNAAGFKFANVTSNGFNLKQSK